MTNPRLKPAVLLSVIGDGYVAFDTERGLLHRLNPTAALIVELCDGRPLDDLKRTIDGLLDEPGWASCAAWLESAMKSGLIVDAAPGSGSDSALTAASLGDRARELRRSGQVVAAFVCQQRAAAIEPGDPHLWYALGELAHIIGRRDEARAAYERYFEHHPEDVEIEHLLVALRDAPPPPRAPVRYIEALYSRFAPHYDANMCDELGYEAPALLYRAMLAILGSRALGGVVDLGCGTGLSGALWRSRTQWLVGVDLSAAMIERARTRGIYDTLHCGEITEWLAGERESFDAIIACDTLIYFGDLELVLTRAASRLAPGGILGFTTERGDVLPFTLTDSGRYSHHPDHVRAAAAAAGLTVRHLGEDVLRHEYGKPVVGVVAVLSRPDV